MKIKNTLRKCRTGAVLTVAGIGLLASGTVHAEEVASTEASTPLAVNAVQDTDPSQSAVSNTAEVVPQSAIDAGFESKAEVEQAIDHVDTTIAGIDTQLAQPDYQPEQTVTMTDTEVVARVDELATEQVALAQEVDATRAVIASNEQELESARAEQTQAQNLVTQAQSAVSDAQHALVDAEASTPAPSTVSVADVDAAVRRVEETQSALSAETAKVNAERVTEEQIVTFSRAYDKGDQTHAPTPYRWPESNNLAKGEFLVNGSFLSSNGEGNWVVDWDGMYETLGVTKEQGDALYPAERQFIFGIYAALDDVQKANGLIDLAMASSDQLLDYQNGLIPSAYYDLMKRRASAPVADFRSHAGMVEDGLVAENAWQLSKYHANGQPKSPTFLAYEFIAATVSEIDNIVPTHPFGHAKTTLLSDARKLWVVPAFVEDPSNPDMYRVIAGYFMKDGASGSVPKYTFAETKLEDGRTQATIDGRPIALGSPMYDKTVATRSLNDAERAARLTPYQDAVSTARADYEAKLAAYQQAQTASTTSSSAVSDARQNLNRAQAVLASAQSNLEAAASGVSAAEQALATSRAQLQSLLSRLRGIETELAQLEGSVDKTVTRPEVPGLTPAERTALEEQKAGLLSERARLVAILNEFGIEVSETQPAAETQPAVEVQPAVETAPVETIPVGTQPVAPVSPSTSELAVEPDLIDGESVASVVEEMDGAVAENQVVAASETVGHSVSVSHSKSVVATLSASKSTLVTNSEQFTSVVVGSTPRRSTQSALPETGSVASPGLAVLGGLLSTFGLVGYRRRK